MKDKSVHEPQKNVWSMAEAKAHFGDLVENAKSPLAGSGLKVRRLGFLAGQFSVPDDFDQMDRAEIEQMFDGRD